VVEVRGNIHGEGRHMRVPWFSWRSSARSEDASWAVSAPRERTDDEVSLALRLIPLYHVLLQLDDPRTPTRLRCTPGWRATLTAMVGAERAQRILSEAHATGVAVIAVCPRELAEHYRDELLRRALPCTIARA
jgi:hypothetical protein